MSVNFKINGNPVITFDLEAGDILTPASGSPVTAVSKLSDKTTMAVLCSAVNCFNCNEILCTVVTVTKQCEDCSYDAIPPSYTCEDSKDEE